MGKSEHERILDLEEGLEELLKDEPQMEFGGAPKIIHNYNFMSHEFGSVTGRGRRPQMNLKHCNSVRIHKNVGDSDDEVNVTLNTATGRRTGTWEVFSAPSDHQGARPANTPHTDWEDDDTGVSKGPIPVKEGESLHIHYNNPAHRNDNHNVQWHVS